MNIAVLADIHGNYAALEAVADHVDSWRPDAVVVAGDIVNRGPRSLECLRFVQARQRNHGWQAISGNHDLYVLQVARGDRPASGVDEAVRQNTRWAADQIGAGVSALGELPEQLSLRAPDGGEARVVHASMRGNRDNIFAGTPDAELRRQIAPAPPLFCCGHTHKPLTRRIDATLVVNAGSVGAPFDGDERAAYAQLSWQPGGWAAEIVRVPYDRARTDRDFHASGFLAESGPAAPLLYAEFRAARPHLSPWMSRYGAAVLSGAISVEQSVAEYLASALV